MSISSRSERNGRGGSGLCGKGLAKSLGMKGLHRRQGECLQSKKGIGFDRGKKVRAMAKDKAKVTTKCSASPRHVARH